MLNQGDMITADIEITINGTVLSIDDKGTSLKKIAEPDQIENYGCRSDLRQTKYRPI